MKRLWITLVLGSSLAWAGPGNFTDTKNIPSDLTSPTVSSTATGSGNVAANPYQGVVDAWGWVGDALRTACSLVQGKPVDFSTVLGVKFPVKIPVGIKWQPELDWVCEAGQTWAFINGVLNQDWAQMAGDIAGQWIGDLATGIATSIGIQVGSQDWSKQITDFNDSLKKGYRDFMSKVRNALWTDISASLNKARQERANGVTVTSNNAVQQTFTNTKNRIAELVPTPLAVVQDKVQDKQGSEKISGVAPKVNKSSEGASKAARAMETLLNKGSSYLGTTDPSGGKGLEQQTLDKAKQAPDTRTAVEVLTEMTGHVLSAELYGSLAIANIVSEIVNQQAITNQLLADMIQIQGYKATSLEEEAKNRIDELATDAMVSEFAVQTAGEATKKIIGKVTDTTVTTEAGF